MTTMTSEVGGAQSARTEPLLELRGVNKSFGAVQVLHDVDLAVRSGRVTALVGDNGAGKSTLIKGVAGHLPVRPRRLPVRGRDRPRPQPEAGQRAGHRGRLPGPRAVRQPRHRPEPLPGPGVPQRGVPRRDLDGGAGRRDPGRPVRAHGQVGPAEGRQPLRRPAPDGRHRPCGAVELQAGHPRRAHRRARRRADRAGAAAGAPARRPRPRRHPDQPQHERRPRRRRRHRGALPGPDDRAGRGQGRQPLPGRRAHHRRRPCRRRPQRTGWRNEPDRGQGRVPRDPARAAACSADDASGTRPASTSPASAAATWDRCPPSSASSCCSSSSRRCGPRPSPTRSTSPTC